MEWEHDHYALRCRKCGHTGWLLVFLPDRDRQQAHWEGFAEITTSYAHPAMSHGRCLNCGNRKHGAMHIEWAGST